MKNKVCYWGSVQFYKHLILMAAALIVLAPGIGLLAMFVWNWKLNQDYHAFAEEKMLYIHQLEEELASYYNIESLGKMDTDNRLEERELQYVLEAQNGSNVSDEVMLTIPFFVDLEDWRYCLVNDRNPLPEFYQPQLTETMYGMQVHVGIADDLERMLSDAEREGLKMIVCSAYRDYGKQAELVENSMEKLLQAGYTYIEAHWETRRQIALVGNSEHHTGLAVDIVGETYQSLDEKQADTDEARWLEEHAHEYGFILRYPKNKEEITGIYFESWHFRYVGKEAAAFIKENQLCLEEFLDLAKEQEKTEEH